MIGSSSSSNGAPSSPSTQHAPLHFSRWQTNSTSFMSSDTRTSPTLIMFTIFERDKNKHLVTQPHSFYIARFMSDYIQSLNEPQREGVLNTEGPCMIIAGAGSGKTRVLTYRIAHLIQTHQVDPFNIMALTFTNKAAKEMRDRIEKV